MLSDVVRIGSIIIFHRSKPWKAKFFILWGNISGEAAGQIWNLGSERVQNPCNSRCPLASARSIAMGEGWFGFPKQAAFVVQLGTFVKILTFPLPRVIHFKFSPALTSNITSRSVKNLAFHGLLSWKMITGLSNSQCLTYTFLFKRLGKCTFCTWERKG